MFLKRSIGKRVLNGLLVSLVFGLSGILPIAGAERLDVEFEEMAIPISIKDLAAWSRSAPQRSSELETWLNLLDSESKQGLRNLLKAPLLKRQSMGRQMLRSWAGRQLLDEVSDLIRLDEDTSGNKVFHTLESLFESQPQVSTLDLLEALPAESIRLDLDALLNLANRWRVQLQRQQNLVFSVQKIKTSKLSIRSPKLSLEKVDLVPEQQFLEVEHRNQPLPLEVWRPQIGMPLKNSWVVFMPGLGGSKGHFQWLARKLAIQGWPVVVFEHPGSDGKAVKGLLEGRRLPPGAEVIPERLEDLRSVLAAKEEGRLKISAKRLVLMGHSLGALTAFLASGAVPEPGLEKRCEKALDDLSLTNLSQLLQCQMIDVPVQPQKPIKELQAIVALNSFGSLLWPNEGGALVPVPVFLAGGTLDLITPPITEQLGLLLSTTSNHASSRSLLIIGASHFSPVRVEGQLDGEKGRDLFQLGEELVGVQPLRVQQILASTISDFLEDVESKQAFLSSLRTEDGDLRILLLDRSSVNRLLEAQY
ncbi:alpha/beta hydrolase [Prochlorococcus sp. MIT 1300]|uniref:alpha/beta hydrolase n=1 Tax=Prochlorococcus sp. MIT 1300 TaxID=3096218 RepID=UPI002A75647A|nr:alpha/beta fold hydrolase [Prochlorococcus sp. MIT 1300]